MSSVRFGLRLAKPTAQIGSGGSSSSRTARVRISSAASAEAAVHTCPEESGRPNFLCVGAIARPMARCAGSFDPLLTTQSPVLQLELRGSKSQVYSPPSVFPNIDCQWILQDTSFPVLPSCFLIGFFLAVICNIIIVMHDFVFHLPPPQFSLILLLHWCFKFLPGLLLLCLFNVCKIDPGPMALSPSHRN